MGALPDIVERKKARPGTVLIKYSRNVHWKEQLIHQPASVYSTLYRSPGKSPVTHLDGHINVEQKSGQKIFVAWV